MRFDRALGHSADCGKYLCGLFVLAHLHVHLCALVSIDLPFVFDQMDSCAELQETIAFMELAVQQVTHRHFDKWEISAYLLELI